MKRRSSSRSVTSGGEAAARSARQSAAASSYFAQALAPVLGRRRAGACPSLRRTATDAAFSGFAMPTTRSSPASLEAVLERGGAGLGGVAGAPRRRLERVGELDVRPAVERLQAGDADEAVAGPLAHAPLRVAQAALHVLEVRRPLAGLGEVRRRRAVPEAHDRRRREHGEHVGASR